MASATLEKSEKTAREVNLPEVETRRFRVDEYYLMAEVGILKSSDRVELLDGVISNMSPIGPAHASVVRRLAELFYASVSQKASIGIQTPIHLNDYSEPEPDLVIAQPRADFYADHHPGTDEIYLLIEVADTTLAKDLNVKVPLYAASSVREVWVVDLPGQKVLQFRNPDKNAYTDVKTLKSGDEIELELSGIEKMRFAVNQILGIS